MENHISSVRRMLLEQMRDLRTAKTPDALRLEAERARSVALVAQGITSVSRLEMEHAKHAYEIGACKSGKVPFLRTDLPSDDTAPQPTPAWPGTTTTHRLNG